jgi:tetratricopeptide (TPR) repeat protein/DNA-binding CsgD family transcriptional regulator
MLPVKVYRPARSLISLICFAFLMNSPGLFAQVNLKIELKNADPVKPGIDTPLEEKIKIHKDYVKEAVQKKDLTQQLYGALYLFDDYLSDQNYTEAIRFLLEAENIAQESGNIGWQGYAKLKSGWISFIVHNDLKAAIRQFESGAKLCAEAKDSLCVGQCFEQISTAYSELKDFDQAYHYFNLAMPVLKRFSKYISLSAAYSNFSTSFHYQGRHAEALLYLDSAIRLAKKEGNFRNETIYMTNLGALYNNMKQYDKALSILKNCVVINQKNNWQDDLVYDYVNMALAYKGKGNYKDAYEYLDKYYTLKDSISGTAVNLKVASLKANNESQKKELMLQKSHLDLALAKRSNDRWTFYLLAISVLTIIKLLIWRWQFKKNKLQLKRNKQTLQELSNLLIEKNTLLAELETQLSETGRLTSEPAQTLQLEDGLYNQRILTDADWTIFKNHFQKAYPGYLLRLRNAYPLITEAEERLFLFIKLNLNNKEVAAILGISAESVKKTRTRLRKRLALDEKTSITEFVKQF